MPRSYSISLRKKEPLKMISRLSRESQSNSPNSSAIIMINASSIRMTSELISQFQLWPLLSGLLSAPMLQFSTTLPRLLNKSKYNYKLYYLFVAFRRYSSKLVSSLNSSNNWLIWPWVKLKIFLSYLLIWCNIDTPLETLILSSGL